jgi:hypothetical protein
LPSRLQWREFGSESTVIGLSACGITSTPFANDHHCDFWTGRPR